MIASTFKLVLLAATFASPFVLAQNETEGNVPACVSTCISSAASIAGCNPTDTECLCSQSQFAYAVGNCIGVSCSVSNINTGRTAVLDLCGLEDDEPAEGGEGEGSTNTTTTARNSTSSGVSGSSNSTASGSSNSTASGAVALPSVVRATGTGGVSWRTLFPTSTSTSTSSTSSSSAVSASGAVANVAAPPSSSATSPASSTSASGSAASATSTSAQSGGASANLPTRWLMSGAGLAAIVLLGA